MTPARPAMPPMRRWVWMRCQRSMAGFWGGPCWSRWAVVVLAGTAGATGATGKPLAGLPHSGAALSRGHLAVGHRVEEAVELGVDPLVG